MCWNVSHFSESLTQRKEKIMPNRGTMINMLLYLTIIDFWSPLADQHFWPRPRSNSSTETGTYKANFFVGVGFEEVSRRVTALFLQLAPILTAEANFIGQKFVISEVSGFSKGDNWSLHISFFINSVFISSLLFFIYPFDILYFPCVFHSFCFICLYSRPSITKTWPTH